MAIQSLLFFSAVVAEPKTRPMVNKVVTDDEDIIILNGWVLLKSDFLYNES